MPKGKIDFDIKLVKIIEQHPCLYNYHLPEYSKRDSVAMAWEKVAQEMNATIQQCKDTWRTLRITFTRSIKLPPSGRGAKKFSQKTNDMIKKMNFIRPYIKNRQDLPSNLPRLPSPESQDTNSGEKIIGVEDIVPEGHLTFPRKENEDVIEPPANAATPQQKRSKQIESPTTKKRKLQPDKDCEVNSYVMDYLRQKQVDSDNPKRLFLLSLLPDLEQMDNHQMRHFRCKVSQLIDDILTKRSVVTPGSINSGKL